MQTIEIHIMPNMARSKGNQIIIFGQSIEYNMKNIFLKNNPQNVMQKLFPDPFLKNRI